MIKRNNQNNLSTSTRLLIFEAERLVFFQQASSRFPLQSFMPNPGKKGFPLQSGLKVNILLFYKHSKNNC